MPRDLRDDARMGGAYDAVTSKKKSSKDDFVLEIKSIVSDGNGYIDVSQALIDRIKSEVYQELYQLAEDEGIPRAKLDEMLDGFSSELTKSSDEVTAGMENAFGKEHDVDAGITVQLHHTFKRCKELKSACKKVVTKAKKEMKTLGQESRKALLEQCGVTEKLDNRSETSSNTLVGLAVTFADTPYIEKILDGRLNSSTIGLDDEFNDLRQKAIEARETLAKAEEAGDEKEIGSAKEASGKADKEVAKFVARYVVERNHVGSNQQEITMLTSDNSKAAYCQLTGRVLEEGADAKKELKALLEESEDMKPILLNKEMAPESVREVIDTGIYDDVVDAWVAHAEEHGSLPEYFLEAIGIEGDIVEPIPQEDLFVESEHGAAPEHREAVQSTPAVPAQPYEYKSFAKALWDVVGGAQDIIQGALKAVQSILPNISYEDIQNRLTTKPNGEMRLRCPDSEEAGKVVAEMIHKGDNRVLNNVRDTVYLEGREYRAEGNALCASLRQTLSPISEALQKKGEGFEFSYKLTQNGCKGHDFRNVAEFESFREFASEYNNYSDHDNLDDILNKWKKEQRLGVDAGAQPAEDDAPEKDAAKRGRAVENPQYENPADGGDVAYAEVAPGGEPQYDSFDGVFGGVGSKREGGALKNDVYTKAPSGEPKYDNADHGAVLGNAGGSSAAENVYAELEEFDEPVKGGASAGLDKGAEDDKENQTPALD